LLRLAILWVKWAALRLDPGYFALVMATGIVSNVFLLQGQRSLSDALFALNVAAYVCLCLLTALRAARFGKALIADLASPCRVFLFFTTIAATDVLATSVGFRGYTNVAVSMWVAAFILWFALIYLGFGVFMLRNTATEADVAQGGWLNAIVGTQSLVIVGAVIAAPAERMGAQSFILLHMLWMLGLALYGVLIVLLFYRFFFHELRTADVAPPLWIVMGAAAISVNAGSVLGAADQSHTNVLLPFVEGVTLATWAWATWCIPLLVLLGLWKHGLHRVPLRYSPMLWSIVFPLGMYATATLRLSRTAAVPSLQSLSWAVSWIALAAWMVTMAGLALTSFKRGRSLLQLASAFGPRTGRRHGDRGC
jgi:tellurite resistance protein TehA-like permease